MQVWTAVIAAALLGAPLLASAQNVSVPMKVVTAQGEGETVGSIRIEQTRYGLVFRPSLTGLTSGLHGFHVHEKPSCAPAPKDGTMTAAEAAGGHLDTHGSKKHGEPWGNGHVGDLPPLFVDGDGNANQPVLAPRLKLSDVIDRSVMVHAGADNHADHPEPMGGGGPRVACGVIRQR